MGQRSNYRTRQREALLDYMRSLPGEHVTAGDACAYLERKGSPIGQTTVYRQLERLVDEGILNKYTIDTTSPACFEYVPASDHVPGKSCYHCKCEKCGRLIHLHCDDVEALQAHLLSAHDFLLDARRTVFYGVCADCAAQEETYSSRNRAARSAAE